MSKEKRSGFLFTFNTKNDACFVEIKHTGTHPGRAVIEIPDPEMSDDGWFQDWVRSGAFSDHVGDPELEDILQRVQQDLLHEVPSKYKLFRFLRSEDSKNASHQYILTTDKRDLVRRGLR
jgi:hypothetical protein